MPTLEHNGLVEMFRENPSLAPHILATVFQRDVPRHASVRVADAEVAAWAGETIDLGLGLGTPRPPRARRPHAIVPRGVALVDPPFGA